MQVWWAQDEQWFEGTVTAYYALSVCHRITYDDGDVEIIALWAPTQAIKLLNSKKEFAAALDQLSKEQQGAERKGARHKKALLSVCPLAFPFYLELLHACTHTCKIKNHELCPVEFVGWYLSSMVCSYALCVAVSRSQNSRWIIVLANSVCKAAQVAGMSSGTDASAPESALVRARRRQMENNERVLHNLFCAQSPAVAVAEGPTDSDKAGNVPAATPAGNIAARKTKGATKQATHAAEAVAVVCSSSAGAAKATAAPERKAAGKKRKA
jgi:hypothetical protein